MRGNAVRLTIGTSHRGKYPRRSWRCRRPRSRGGRSWRSCCRTPWTIEKPETYIREKGESKEDKTTLPGSNCAIPLVLVLRFAVVVVGMASSTWFRRRCHSARSKPSSFLSLFTKRVNSGSKHGETIDGEAGVVLPGRR